MKTYNELKERQQKEVDTFPFGAAFNKEQFEEMQKKLPLDEGDKYYSLGAGMFVRGKDIPAMKEMFARHKKKNSNYVKTQKIYMTVLFANYSTMNTYMRKMT